MKKFAFLIITVTTIGKLQSQNVAINGTGAAPNTSAMLDVAANNKGVSFPNVSLTSNTDAVTVPTPMTGLMVYNTNAAMPCGAGLYYNNNTAASPVWVCFQKQQQVVQLYGTSARLAVTSNVATLQPGLTTNIVVPTGQTVQVTAICDIGTRNTSTTAGNFSGVDVIFFVNGAFLPQGGWNRFTTVNHGTGNSLGTIPVSATFTLTAGTHVFQVRTSRVSGNTSVDIGGNCTTDTNCGEVTLFINYK